MLQLAHTLVTARCCTPRRTTHQQPTGTRHHMHPITTSPRCPTLSTSCTQLHHVAAVLCCSSETPVMQSSKPRSSLPLIHQLLQPVGVRHARFSSKQLCRRAAHTARALPVQLRPGGVEVKVPSHTQAKQGGMVLAGLTLYMYTLSRQRVEGSCCTWHSHIV